MKASHDMISAQAPAKVNLNLHILGQADNGYHKLDSLVVFTDFGDEIHIKKAAKTTYKLKGECISALSMDDDNLVVKAHKSLEEAARRLLPCEITLVKKLPIAAGVGGGSSNGATVLKLINKLFTLNISQKKLRKIGLNLGADFPVCLHGQACFMSGIGEIITPIANFPKLHIALINPKKATSTKQVFKLLNHRFSSPLPYQDSFHEENLFSWLKQTHNDLQQPAISLTAEIATILKGLEYINAQHSSSLSHYGMSGSGATCYMISPSNSVIEATESYFKKYDYLQLRGKIL